MVDWGSSKQKRVSHSSYGTESLACAEANDRVFRLKESLSSICNGAKIKHVLMWTVGVFKTLLGGYRLRKTVQRIQDSLENSEIEVLRCMPSKANIAEGLKTRDPNAHRLLNPISSDGTLDFPTHDM